MSLTDFLTDLSKTDRTWALTEGFLRNAEGACPLVAVRAQRGQAAHEAVTGHRECLCLLRLSVHQVRAVIVAADLVLHHSRQLRGDLLQACGLVPEKGVAG